MTKGDRIKFAREREGLTQESLGEKCGVKKQTIHKYEVGIITNIPSEMLQRIAECLNVSSAWLLGEEADQQFRGVKKWADDFRFSSEQKSRIQEYLSESELRQKALVEALANSAEKEKIPMTDEIQRATENLSHWVSNALRYINNDYSDDPFSDSSILEQYHEAISKMSRRDQVAWLVRIQDYIDGKR